MNITISLPLLMAIIFGASMFTLFIFSFLVASKKGDEEFEKVLEREHLIKEKFASDEVYK